MHEWMHALAPSWVHHNRLDTIDIERLAVHFPFFSIRGGYTDTELTLAMYVGPTILS